MTNSVGEDEQTGGSQAGANSRIMIVVGLLLMVVGLLIVAAVILAMNAQTAAPSVRVVRDLLIIVISLEVIIVGAAVVVFLIQLARLINLVRNEIEPLVEAATETVDTVRGTALFLSKNVIDPVTNMSSVVRGLGKIAGDVDAIRRAAGIVVEAASAASPSGAVGQPAVPRAGEQQAGDSTMDSAPKSPKKQQRKRKPTKKV